MATGYPYDNVPLNEAKREIRVLSFPASKKILDGPLKFSFKTVSLHGDRTPTYYAVSYTWGSSGIRRDIIVDDHTVSVPQNTDEALRRLCRHRPGGSIPRVLLTLKGEIMLWIDAICINQADARERSWQVAMMGLVYSAAEEVLIWLGHGGDGENASVAVVKKLIQHCRRNTGDFQGLDDLIYTPPNTAGVRNPQYGDIFRSLSLPGSTGHLSQDSRLALADAEIRFLFEFFSKPWFTRVWAVQEVILAKRPVCYFGEHSIPAWDVLMAAVWVIYGSVYLTKRGLEPLRGLNCANMMYTITRFTKFNEVLQCVRGFDCSDPRDKIYAVLHLMPRRVREKARRYAPIEPDYTKSIEMVWADATRAAILEGSDLRLLRYAGLYALHSGERVDRESLPSWVPNYDDFPTPTAFEADHDYRWFKGSLHTEEYHEYRAVLSIKGTTLEQITQVGTSYTGKSNPNEIEEHLRRELASTWLSVQPCLALQRGESITSAIGTVFTSGMRHSSTGANEEQFDENVNRIVHSLRHDSTSAEHSVTNVVTNQEKPFVQGFYWFSQHRVLFIGDSGRVGMAPVGTQNGDTVVQLFGCEIPFILRQEGEYWRLVGDVYFHNLPDHIRDLQQSGLYPSPRFFKIR